MTGRSIRNSVVDGIASGLRTAELGLSTIKGSCRAPAPPFLCNEACESPKNWCLYLDRS